MKYTISIERAGQTIGGYDDLTQKEAMATAKEESAKTENEYNSIFITWFRPSDGQHGYLNPSGDHEITGKNWNKNMIIID